MERKKQPKWKRLLPPVLWTGAGMALFILLVSAISRNSQLHCKGLEISIEGYKNEMFISEADVKALIEADLSHPVKGCVIDDMNLRRLERGLQKDNWVSKAQLFIDNKQVLHVNIGERLPVARIFTQNNRSFYIDSQAVILPLSVQQIADVPVFTNLPDRPKQLAGSDSSFWQQIGKMGSYIISDTFLLMQIGQVNVTLQKELELYPVIGNHVVLFGTPDNYEKKLNRLKNFDKQVLAKAGLNKYSRLDLRYDKQVVATLRGKEELPAGELNILPDIDLIKSPVQVSQPQPPKSETVKETKRPEKKPVIASKKREQKQQTAKTIKKKPVIKPEKNTATVQRKKPAVKTEKINVASNNKPGKKTIQQLPKKPGLIEIDIRQRRETKKDHLRAVMPKKE